MYVDWALLLIFIFRELDLADELKFLDENAFELFFEAWPLIFSEVFIYCSNCLPWWFTVKGFNMVYSYE